MTPCITIECCAEEKKTEKSSPHWERKEKTAVNDQLCTSFLDGRLSLRGLLDQLHPGARQEREELHQQLDSKRWKVAKPDYSTSEE